MASSLLKSLRKSTAIISLSSSPIQNQISSTTSAPSLLKTCSCAQLQKKSGYGNAAATEEYGEGSTEGISRPMSEILKQLNKKVPNSVICVRNENGSSVKYIHWHIVNRIMNLHAPEWSGEVRSIAHTPDGKSVTGVYRVTLHGTDAEIYRESTGTAAVDEKGFGDAVQKAEGMAFRRACARLGLGLHLYHVDMS